jgi:hypothetical protein
MTDTARRRAGRTAGHGRVVPKLRRTSVGLVFLSALAVADSRIQYCEQELQQEIAQGPVTPAPPLHNGVAPRPLLLHLYDLGAPVACAWSRSNDHELNRARGTQGRTLLVSAPIFVPAARRSDDRARAHDHMNTVHEA